MSTGLKENLKDLDRASHLHPFTPPATLSQQGPSLIAEGKGIYVKDTAGKDYIDAMAGLWCVNIGWGREEVAEAISAQIKKLAYYHAFAGFGTEPTAELAARVLKLLPIPMSKIFFGNSGSDANDSNIKMVWLYNNLRDKPQKKKIIARQRSYHGVTVVAASLTGLPHMHKAFDLPLDFVKHTHNPHYYTCAPEGMSERDWSQHLANELEALILAEGPDTIAAFIAEPLMGAGGVILPPEGYFEAIQPILSKYDILLIADEVICGFGRLGTWFGSGYYNLKPDIITIAKGLTSGYVPMSGSIISEKVWDVLVTAESKLGGFNHGFTYSSHPVAAAAGLANLDIMERENLVGNSQKVGAYFQRKLREAFSDHPLVGEVRGVGLVAAVEFVKDKAKKTPFDLTQKVAVRMNKHCLSEGVISRALPLANAMSFSPPLIITEAECDEVIARFAKALNKLADELVREGIWS